MCCNKLIKAVRLNYSVFINPPFKDALGNKIPPFTGEQFVRANDFEFYSGDCIWEPLENKLGKWELTTWHEGKIVAQKTFALIKK